MTEEKEETEPNNSGISRRKFIQGTTTGVALMAGGALLTSAIPAVHAQTANGAAAGNKPATTLLPVKPALSGSRPVVGASPPITWDKVVDVVVVGAGGAGLSAAIEAAEAGSNTIIIEKMDHWGGLYMTAGGAATIGGNNHIQQRDGITGDSIPLWYRAEMWGADYRGNPELVQTYVEHGDEWLAWMESLGAVWTKTSQGIYGSGTLPNGDPLPARGMSLAASSNYPTTTGFNWTYLMHKRVASLNIPILLQTRMTQIYRLPDGPVIGVAADTPNGPINIHAAQAVIVATGGTADNAQLMHSFDPRYDNDMLHDGAQPPGTEDFVQNTGDGHLAIQAVGGGLTDMSYAIYCAVHYGTHLYFVWSTQNPRNYLSDVNPAGVVATSTGLSISNYQYVICVKGDGNRFVNEMAASTSISTSVGIDPYAPPNYANGGEWTEHQFIRAWLNLPDRPRNCWAICDSVGVKALNWNTTAMANPNPLVSPALYPDAVAIANDLPTLALQMGINPAGLVNTVTKYNSYVDSGKDPDFGKPTPQYKIATPPYYAAKMILIKHTQRNGIRTNSRSQVIDQIASQWNSIQGDSLQPMNINQEPVIPHLYAAGEASACFGWRRYHNSLAAYSLWGRIAGQNAAAEPRQT
jgi:succinate dehydrogenase/fumarate reductase flavoprotein subunit